MSRKFNQYPALAFSVLLLALYCAPSINAQVSSGGGYAVTQKVIAGGGDTSAGGGVIVTGTIAQHDAGMISGGTYTLSGGFWPADDSAAPTPATCGTDVTSQMSITRSDFSVEPITHRFQQSVTIRNDSPVAIATPLAYVVEALTPGVVLYNQAAVTSCAALNGSPYAIVTNGTSQLAPGESVILDLDFVVSGTLHSISYTPRLLSGKNW